MIRETDLSDTLPLRDRNRASHEATPKKFTVKDAELVASSCLFGVRQDLELREST